MLNGKIYVFQEDGTGGYHAYPATGNEVYTKFPRHRSSNRKFARHGHQAIQPLAELNGKRERFDMPQSPNSQIVKKVKKLSEVAGGARARDGTSTVTRLTTIKSLCEKPEGPQQPSLCSWLRRIQSKMRQEQSPERYRELVDRAVKELKPYLPIPLRNERNGFPLCREMEKAEQNEYKKIGWDMVRMLRSRDLVVVEESLKSVLKSYEAPIWAYQAAKDYAEALRRSSWVRVDPKAAPMVEEIAGFWRSITGLRNDRSG